MFEFIQQAVARARLQERFGGGDRGGAHAGDAGEHAAAPMMAASGKAPPGAYSPAADTVVDDYHANRAALDSRWAGNDLLARAMARHRGEEVAPQAIKPEPGAPKTSRPLADPAQLMASIFGISPAPAAAPAAPAMPSPAAQAGMSEEESYRARRAAMDARPGQEGYQRALARHAAKK
jgi:hypothetical protein